MNKIKLSQSEVESLNKDNCPYCNGLIFKSAEGSGTENFICSDCQSVFAFYGFAWDVIRREAIKKDGSKQ